MPRRRPVRVTRDQPGGINPVATGARHSPTPHSTERWASRMGSSAAGAKEVLVKISGGGREADGVQAHLEYIDRHRKLELEADYGERLQRKTAGTALVYGGSTTDTSPVAPIFGAPLRRMVSGARLVAFNIVLSMPAGNAA
jgi:hypothetical protein